MARKGRTGGGDAGEGEIPRKPSRKRKEPRPPLQAAAPQEEGAPGPGVAAPGGPAVGKAGTARPSKAGNPKGPRVADIMTEDPLCCLPDTPLAAVARLMAENSCGAIPVIAGSGDRRPVGMVTDRDLALRSVAEGLNPLAMAARDVMTPSPVSIAPDASAEEGAELMRQHRLRRILVVDGTGTLRGLLAQGQIASNLPHDRSGGMVRGISRPNP